MNNIVKESNKKMKIPKKFYFFQKTIKKTLPLSEAMSSKVIIKLLSKFMSFVIIMA